MLSSDSARRAAVIMNHKSLLHKAARELVAMWQTKLGVVPATSSSG